MSHCRKNIENLKIPRLEFLALICVYGSEIHERIKISSENICVYQRKGG
jgi:hypothetical protein